jgi:hypothetical protein
VRSTDRPGLIAKKLLKSLLSRPWATAALETLIGVAQRTGWPDRALFPAYRAMIGIYTFRGWRTGLREPGG